MDNDLGKTMKEARDLFGELLMSTEFIENFYMCFFTLCPASELRFTDVEKQKKAFHGFITSLLKMSEDPDAHDKLEWIRKKHKRMKVKGEEIKGFCQSLLVTVKCSNKLSPSQQKVATRIEKMINELQKYMLNEDESKGGCLLQ